MPLPDPAIDEARTRAVLASSAGFPFLLMLSFA